MIFSGVIFSGRVFSGVIFSGRVFSGRVFSGRVFFTAISFAMSLISYYQAGSFVIIMFEFLWSHSSILRPCYIFEKFCFVTHDFLIFMGDRKRIFLYIA